MHHDPLVAHDQHDPNDPHIYTYTDIYIYIPKPNPPYTDPYLYKPKPIKEGTEVQTRWGTAEVHKALINGDLELTWPGHSEAGVRTIKASDMGKLAWKPEEKEERSLRLCWK